MNKSIKTNCILKLVDTYIVEKRNAYNNYEKFASLTEEEKISFLLQISEKDYGSKLINTAIINTYIYPNDDFLIVACGNLLDENVDKFLESFGLSEQMFEEKKMEFKFFQFVSLSEKGFFGKNMINQSSIYGDNLINNKDINEKDRAIVLKIK